MSHLDDSNFDLEGLEVGPNMPVDVAESIKKARMQARTIINRLKPRHITSWANLLQVLEKSLEEAQLHCEQFGIAGRGFPKPRVSKTCIAKTRFSWLLKAMGLFLWDVCAHPTTESRWTTDEKTGTITVELY